MGSALSDKSRMADRVTARACQYGMLMPMLEVSRSIVIQRALVEVQAQFGDVAYHERRGHHRGVQFLVTRDDAAECEYDQITRIGPKSLRQRFRLDRADPAHQVNALLEGVFAPGSITFDFAASGADATQVRATLRSEASGAARLAAPLLRRLLGRALAQGLDEDRNDLESGDYARRAELGATERAQ